MNSSAQMRAVARALPDNGADGDISGLCTELTFDLCQTSRSRFTAKAFTENRLGLIREYYQLEIQSVVQRFGRKKLRRLRQKINSGNSVFVRMYDKKAGDKCSFTYEQVNSIRNIAGFGLCKLSDGRWHTSRSLEKRSSAAFETTGDWAVYEDINFYADSVSGRSESCREVYIRRLISGLKCFIGSRLAENLTGSSKVTLDESFMEQRRAVFEEALGLGDSWRELYRKKHISGAEFLKSLKKEQKMLEAQIGTMS